MQINKIPKDADGKSHGLWEQYFDNGQLWFKGEFINGKIHGPWIEYFEDGSLCSKQTLDMGKRIGYFIHNYAYRKPIKRFYAN